MSMPGSAGRDPDQDFRLLHDEANDDYYIQKRRVFLGGYKFTDYKYDNYKDAIWKLNQLRIENKKRRVKKRFVILDD